MPVEVADTQDEAGASALSSSTRCGSDACLPRRPAPASGHDSHDAPALRGRARQHSSSCPDLRSLPGSECSGSTAAAARMEALSRSPESCQPPLACFTKSVRSSVAAGGMSITPAHQYRRSGGGKSGGSITPSCSSSSSSCSTHGSEGTCLPASGAHTRTLSRETIEGLANLLWTDEPDVTDVDIDVSLAEDERAAAQVPATQAPAATIRAYVEVLTYERWRGKQTFIVRALDDYFLAPWWRAHVHVGVHLSEGNTRDKFWYPRANMPLFAAMLCLVCFGAIPLLRAASHSTHHSVKGLLLLSGMLVAGFVYTNFVTTARDCAFRGRHGGYRDIMMVLAFTPYLWYTSLLPYTSIMFAPDADTHHGMLLACIFVGFYLLGLHTPYLVRAGIFQKSVSQAELASGSWGVKVSILTRLIIIGGFVCGHLLHLLDTGLLVQRGSQYALILASIVAVSVSTQEAYYLHWHHWIAGLMLSPLCHNRSTEVSVAFLGFVAAQFAEGAARWSCAPMWHRHHLEHDVRA